MSENIILFIITHNFEKCKQMFKINVPNKCSDFLLTNSCSDGIVFVEYMFGIVVRYILTHSTHYTISSTQEESP